MNPEGFSFNVVAFSDSHEGPSGNVFVLPVNVLILLDCYEMEILIQSY